MRVLFERFLSCPPGDLQHSYKLFSFLCSATNPSITTTRSSFVIPSHTIGYVGLLLRWSANMLTRHRLRLTSQSSTLDMSSNQPLQHVHLMVKSASFAEEYWNLPKQTRTSSAKAHRSDYHAVTKWWAKHVCPSRSTSPFHYAPYVHYVENNGSKEAIGKRLYAEQNGTWEDLPPHDGHQMGKLFDLHMGHLYARRCCHDVQQYAPRRHSDRFYAFRVAGKEDLHTQLHSNNFPPTIATIVSWLADIGKG